VADPLNFLLDIADGVQRSDELEPALHVLVEGVGRLQGWDVGEAWVLAGDGRTIEVGAWWVRDEALAPFVIDAAGHGYHPGRGIVRETWEARRAAWHEELLALPADAFLRLDAARRHGIRSAALVPVLAGERTLAVLLFFSTEARRRDEASLRLMRAAAAQVAWLLERRVQTFARDREHELLVASEGSFRELFANNPLPMWVFDTTTLAFLEVNQAAIELYGFGREDFLDRTILDIRPPEDRGPLLALVSAQRPLLSRSGRWRHLTADGRVLDVDVTSHLTTFEGREARLVVARDIGREVRAEREEERQREELERRVAERTADLTDLNRELEGFTYSVSHDLRAPLRAIDGFSLALLEDRGDVLDERGRHYLERVRAATQRMGLLIDDLLALSRVSRAELARRKVDLAQVARGVLAELQELEPEREVEVVVPRTLPAAADRNLMTVLLHNLLANAWKFTARTDRARIELRGERLDGEMAYTVRDNGAGFDMRYAEQLFVPFQRLHTVEEFPGIGVGLATVQRIVRRHGGRVWGEGEIGRGAAFHFTLGERTT
jgi:hypothetical protein